jgi:cholesterol oxidase
MLLVTALAPGGKPLHERLGFALGRFLRHPLTELRAGVPWRATERGIIALVMQTADNSLTVSLKRRGRGLTSRQGEGEPNPDWLPQAHRATEAMAAQLEEDTGVRTLPRGTWLELFGVPLTAHFMGGAVISATPDAGVVDPYHRVWNYPGLHIVDGSAISANLGVNPSLTITAQAERAFALWPAKGDEDARPPQGGPYRMLSQS